MHIQSRTAVGTSLALVAVVGALLTGCAALAPTTPAEDLASISAGMPQARKTTGRNTDPPRVTSKPDPEPKAGVQIGSGQFIGKAVPSGRDDDQGDTYTLNLVDVPVAQAAKAILGDVLKVNYTVEDAVKGTLTLQTTRPASAAVLLEAFEVALRAKGAGIQERNGAYHILIVRDGMSVGTGIVTPDNRNNASVRVGARLHVVPLKFIGAREMERILKPIAPKGAIARVDETRNLILLAGTGAELAGLMEAIEIFDVDLLRGRSVGLFPMQASDPEAVARELEAIFATGQEGAQKGTVRFIPNRRLNAILAIATSETHLDAAEVWIGRLDAAAKSNEPITYVYHIQNRPAGELAKVLQRLYGANIEASPPSAANAVAPRFGEAKLGLEALRPAAQPGSPASPALMRAPLADKNGPTEPASPADDEGEPKSGAVTQSKIKIVGDEANNSLLILARPADYRRILKTLRRIDVVAAQVMLEATIAEVSLNDQLKFGLRWYFANKNSNYTLSDAANGVVGSVFPGFSYFFSTPNVQVALNALADITTVNVVSTPTLMVLDNKTAVLQVGDQVPITTQSAVSTIAGSSVINSVSFRDTGVILSVTPRISERGRIVLEIEQEVSDVVKTTTSNIDSPTIQQRRIKTTVAVNDGDGLALGGLMQEKSKVGRSQVPLAGDLPLVGNLFKSKTDAVERTELLILIRPHVVRNAQDAREITSEFKRHLNLTLRSTAKGPPTREENLRRLAR